MFSTSLRSSEHINMLLERFWIMSFVTFYLSLSVSDHHLFFIELGWSDWEYKKEKKWYQFFFYVRHVFWLIRIQRLKIKEGNEEQTTCLLPKFSRWMFERNDVVWFSSRWFFRRLNSGSPCLICRFTLLAVTTYVVLLR